MGGAGLQTAHHCSTTLRGQTSSKLTALIYLVADGRPKLDYFRSILSKFEAFVQTHVDDIMS